MKTILNSPFCGSAKINEKEHEVLPRAIELISKDKLLFDGRKVLVKD